MTKSPRGRFAAGAWPLAATVAAATGGFGCATPESASKGVEVAQATAPAPTAPARSVSDFSGALRCMDGLLHDHGVRDLSVVVEDLADPTQRFGAGTKDMLVSAVADMTQRSRAIRLIASGKDWGQTQNVMAQAQKKDAFAVLPQYALRGSVSAQGHTNGATLLALNLTLLSTQDMSVVPGTSSRNVLTMFERGSGRDGQAELSKFGTRFSVASTSGSGQTPALRALVDVAAVELVGRVARVPYWSCLGGNANDESVIAEVQDWYDAMAARPAELIAWFQRQLRTRRAYDGPIDGVVNAPLRDAVARYRDALGLTREAKLSLDFFKAYLGADHAALEAKLAPRAAAPIAVAQAPTAAPLALRIAPLNEARRFARGEAVQLSIRPNRDAHVYCFLQDEQRKITRFFPNRWARDSRVQTGTGLQLPGAMRFELVMNPRGVPETVACFATEQDVLALLPAALNPGDFTPLAAANLEQVRSAFAKASGGALAQESFEMRAK